VQKAPLLIIISMNFKIYKIILFFGLTSLMTLSSFAQSKYDYNWVFMKTKFSFHEDTVKVSFYDNPITLGFSNATFSDEEGHFLGYTNGCRIYNPDLTIVNGTDSLNYSNPSYVYDDFCTEFHLGYQSGNHGMMTLPSDSSLFLFHEIVDFNFEDDFFGFAENIYFSELSNQENMLELVSLQNPILDKGVLGTGAMSAVKTADEAGWWIIKNDLHSNCYYSILFKEGIFIEEKYECIGNENSSGGNGGGEAVFSPQGDKYAKFSPGDALFLFDFDRETGELSNYKFIDIPQTGLFGGLSFSPSGQFLYVSDRLYIRQYDVWSSDIEGSEVVVAEYDGFIGNSLGQGTTFGQMQLAPDCRIYLNTSSSQEYMHVIMHPDRKGVGCDVKQHSIDIFFPNARSMPYFPNYRLGTDEPLCDSTKVIVLNGTLPPLGTTDLEGEIKTYPNPASDFINIVLYDRGNYEMNFLDLTGVIAYTYETKEDISTVDIRSLKSGIYILRIKDKDSGRTMVKKVVVR